MYLSPCRMARTTALLVAMGATAHAAGDGNLSVAVTDASGKAFAGATVIVTSPTQIGGARTMVTDAMGRARFVRLAPGFFKIQVSASGYQTQTNINTVVLVDQTASVSTKMVPVGAAVVEVLASASQVDTTTVTQGMQIADLELSRLPVGRDQLSTLNLAPGVMASMSGNGNPSLAAGLGRDNLGGNGGRNNTYMIDGIDVTSPEAGTLRTAIAPELIQVQDVKTGAITAEYSARAGLFSSVTTKVGGNEFSAGLTAAFAPGSLQNSVAPGRFVVAERNSSDLSVWAMGPIIKDKLWYVVSAQKVKDEVKVKLAPTATPTPGESRTGLLQDGSRLFAKLTWQITSADLLSATFNSNPFEFDNLGTPTTLTRRAAKTEQGGNRYILSYGHQWSNVFLDVHYAVHQEDNKITGLYTSDGPQNTIRSASPITSLQQQLGNSAALDKREYEKNLGRADITWLFDAAGTHTLKAGFQFGEEQLTQTVGVSQGAQYDSFDIGTYTWGALPTSTMSGAKSVSITAINNSPTLKAAFIGAGFTPTSTTTPGNFVTSDLNSYVFNEANPLGGFYSYRIIQESLASSTPKMKTQGFYVQDQWQIGRWNFSPGVRLDKYEFLADNGTSLFKTDFAVAPRIGLTWDVRGDGKSKAYAYWGRYVDPIKLDMVRFTGSLTSSVRQEQARLMNQWVTVITRGGSKVVDAVFANSFKLPKTDEFRIGYQVDFANAYTFDATFTKRRDYDIVEDWDPSLYTDAGNLEAEARGLLGLSSSAIPTATQQTIINGFRNLVIDPNYFAGGGFTGPQNVARIGTSLNFILANLPGGERTYRTLDLTLTRREANHWGGFMSLSLVNAKGNSMSSGNADFQGDLAQYDPRLPYTNGRLEGSVDWLAKANGFYVWDMGLMVGMTFNANSGYHYTRGTSASTRVLQQFPGANGYFAENLGSLMTPMVYQADLRVQYTRNFGKVRGEVYLDIINATNRQEATDLAEGLNIRPGVLPDAPYQYQAPRRYNFGIRLKY